MSKLLIATSGTLGDIRPLLAIAMAARDKGHEILVATSTSYRELVATCGLCFEAFGDDSYLDSRQIRREIVRPETGFARFMAESSLWNLEEMFRRLASLADNADVIVSTPLVTVAHLVAEYLQLPLVSCCLSPAVLLRNWGGATFDPYAREWRARLTALRSTYGLIRRSFPQMGRFAGDLMLGLYPRCLTSSPDLLLSMPKEVGYPILKVDAPVQDDLAEWMTQEPFILVSFGSFVDHRVEALFDSMQKASVALGMRLLFVSNHGSGTIAQAIGPRTRVERYVSHTSAMPLAKVVVHHGGSGSLATAARSGRPMVVVPFGLDQVYNAELLQQRGLAEVCDPDAISTDVIESALRRSLERWSDRTCLWQDWSDAEAPSPSQRALDAIEGVVGLG